MADTVYSFKDYTVSIASIAGVYNTEGSGIGNASVTMSTAKSSHNVSADGTVMTSKIAGDNGMVSITCQQVSDLNTWFTKLYNLKKLAPSGSWNSTQISITNKVQKEVLVAIGCSFEKLPDKPIQAEGQMITWNFLSTNISQLAL